MTVRQCVNYLSNQDSSSVLFKSFNQAKDDIYPTFTICLKSTSKSTIFDPTKFPKGFLENCTAKHMGYNVQNCLSENALGYRDLLRGHPNNLTSLPDFDDVSVDVTKDIIVAFEVSLKHQEEEEGVQTKDKISELHLSYQDSGRICITRKSVFVPNEIRNIDTIKLLIPKLKQFQLWLHAYVHYPGHLIRSFGKMIHVVTTTAMSKSNLVTLEIRQVQVLRKRKDATSPCDDDLQNDDRKWREVVMDKVGCIPSYWKRLVGNSTKPDIAAECTRSEQLREIYYHYSPYIRMDNGTKHYDPPCTKMTSVTTVREHPQTQKTNLTLKFKYIADEYQETINIRSFELESMFSQIGGIIGNSNINIENIQVLFAIYRHISHCFIQTVLYGRYYIYIIHTYTHNSIQGVYMNYCIMFLQVSVLDTHFFKYPTYSYGLCRPPINVLTKHLEAQFQKTLHHHHDN